MDMQKLDQWYRKLEALEQSGVVGDAYGGTGAIETDVDWEVIFSFYEYITETYEECPYWANAFIQIYSWQYQNYYEGIFTYYENLYEYTDYDCIMETREFISRAGYNKLAECYNNVLFEEDVYGLDEIKKSLKNASKWLDANAKIVQDFYIDVLKKHRSQLEKEIS